jgi:hypothetical protein
LDLGVFRVAPNFLAVELPETLAFAALYASTTQKERHSSGFQKDSPTPEAVQFHGSILQSDATYWFQVR